MSTSDIFFEAIQAGDAGRVRTLLKETPELLAMRTAAGVSPVLLAVYHQQEEVLSALLEQHPQLDCFEAAALGNVGRVATLVEERPERVREHSSDGFTALGLAAFFGRQEAIEYLVSVGADVNAASRNAMRVRPLHSAVACRKPRVALAMAETLLSNGADVHTVQQGGWTPLHQAAAHGHMEMVELLLRYGAGPEKGNEEGITPIEMAERNGHMEVAQLLRATLETG